MKINLRAKKTEGEWAETSALIYAGFAELWFRLVEWILVTSAFKYFSEKTGAEVFKILYGLSLLAIVYYLQAFFAFRLEIQFFDVSKKWGWWAHLALNLIVVGGGWLLSYWAITEAVSAISKYDFT